MTTHNYYCVILAGGKGRRLWPCSRENMPKQFLDFFGTGRTQLQQTYDRFANIVPKENIFISTNIIYKDIVKEQLPELSDSQILAEPIYRNTAPSLSWANHRIESINPNACIIATPSDQIVIDEEAFRRNVLEGLAFVEGNDRLLTMGVKPTRPEPGYGYIQLGDPIDHDLYKVQSFTEKPEREFARLFMERGEFYWNTGLFLANVCYLRQCFTKFLPPVLRTFDSEGKDGGIEAETRYMMENFPSYPNLSVDSAVLEKSENVYVMKCDFGWADLGTWHSIYEAMQKGENDNVVIDSDVIMDNSTNNVVKLPKGKLAVINGLDGFIVAEAEDVLLICRKEDSSALVRKFVNEVQIRKGDKYV